ncbi:N-acetyltransferase [Nocardioides sp. W3-2-3]|uniref:GNAT family N-acetyltransferase n=1 Tax=Nocardioides convexus TaxID=2712224 RepID=UPI002418B12F|nr:GNAT family N-acetyltransferase [Nocardioides convexus]NHA01956.1 N-acetyltransferase [Nocardioides convexus]
MTDAGITYVHAPEHHRYEIRDGETLAGFTQYRLPDDVHVDFVHTEVDDSYGGQGLAGHVVEFALADVRARGKRIIAHCPYVAKWLTKHPEYDDITDPAA